MTCRINPEALVQQRYADGDLRQSFMDYAHEQAENADFDPNAIVIAIALNGKILYLNLMAAIVMEWAGSGKDPALLTEQVIGIFDVPRQRAAEDIAACVEDLVKRGLLVE